MDSAASLFDEIARRYVADPAVEPGTGFGSNPGLRVGGHIFAMLVRGDLVVKLSEGRVRELRETGVGAAFTAGKGKPMREWLAVPVESAGSWAGLVAEAREYAGGERA